MPTDGIFSAPTWDWFRSAFEAPTAAQEQAWPAIASGEHVLISAPTGSGKTLAAFLYAIDQLAAGVGGSESKNPRERRIGLVYVSPLKALSYDIDRNLRTPLRGHRGVVGGRGRTGDTPQRERQQMLRSAPDILITTPESLYLMLTGRARELFDGTRWCIVDEIHAVASTKRGSHLALTLERLTEAAGVDVQRIGLSATQNPLEEVGRFMVGPQRHCRIVDTGVRKELDLKIHVPVESMVEPEGTPAPDVDPLAGGEATRRSIWPAIYPELVELIGAHKSTILFVNNRRAAERLALRLNDLAGAEIARSHHGSLAREERTVVEELLKAGELPCLVATSSLELGIDMGAVDLVIQVESPKSVARGLQRIGRAGHSVGDVSRGRIFPKFRADLLECAVVARRMREAQIETTVVPRNALDVLAQQIVAIAASAGDDASTNVDDLYALVTRTHSYAELSRSQLENVLDMLDGRYPSSEFSELRPRIVWDRVAGTIRARPGARQLAVTNAGTIPDRGLYAVTLPDGRRVGELDEEMVYEARPGQTFLLGATTWRIEEIGRDRVIVTPAPGLPGAVPFWKGDTLGRPRELGEAIGAFARWAVDQPAEVLEREYDLDERAARNLIEFLAEQQSATRVIPSDRTIVVERFRDEIGDWRLCVLSPFGGRVHAAWALALSARIRDQLGLESDAIYSDDGIIIHLPDAEEPPGADLVMLEPDEIEDMVVAELGSSALFGARFRENAARSLLIPRARPGRRTPLWQQRLKAQSLLEVARKYGEFPVVLETYRECLRDVLDVPGLVELLTKLHRRELTLVEIETPTASPFASSLLFDYVATYMYEGDTPNAERRAAALSLDRDLLRELLGQEELRDLIDADALASVEADLQCRSDMTRATGRDGLLDVLRRVGDLSLAEVSERVLDGLDPERMLEELRGERRVARGAGARRAALDRRRRRRPVPRRAGGGAAGRAAGGVPGGRARRPVAAAGSVRRHPRPVHRRRRAGSLRDRRVRGARASWSDRGSWFAASCGPADRIASGATPRSCVACAAPRWPCCGGRSSPPRPVQLARFAPAWQGVDRFPASGAGIDRLREVLVTLQGLALPADVWERDVLPRRVGAYSPSWIDQLCASGELVWVGAGALGRNSGRVALYFREDLALLGPPPGAKGSDGVVRHRGAYVRSSSGWQRGACFFTDLLVDCRRVARRRSRRRCGTSAWAGVATNDAFAPLRAPRLTLARAQRDAARRAAGSARRAGRFGAGRRRRDGAAAQVAGPLVADRVRCWARVPTRAPGGGRWPSCCSSATGSSPVSRCWPRESPAASRRSTRSCRSWRRSASPAAATSWRGSAGRSSRCPARSSGCALAVGAAAASDEDAAVGAGRRRPRAAVRGGTAVAESPTAPSGAEPLAGGRRGSAAPTWCSSAATRSSTWNGAARGCRRSCRGSDARLTPALSALVAFARGGAIKRLALEKVDGESAMSSPLAPALTALGFAEGPRRLTLTA